jgi:uncharacterized membrane protein
VGGGGCLSPVSVQAKLALKISQGLGGVGFMTDLLAHFFSKVLDKVGAQMGALSAVHRF